MGALVGLGVGIGLMLVWSAFALPRQPRRTTSDRGRTAQLLARQARRNVQLHIALGGAQRLEPGEPQLLRALGLELLDGGAGFAAGRRRGAADEAAQPHLTVEVEPETERAHAR